MLNCQTGIKLKAIFYKYKDKIKFNCGKNYNKKLDSSLNRIPERKSLVKKEKCCIML